MSLTQQLAKVIAFNYYFLIYPLFQPAIKIYRRLLTGRLTSGVTLLFLGLSLLVVIYEDNRVVRQLFPGTAEIGTREIGYKRQTEITLFEDGALCESEEEAGENWAKSQGMVPIFRLRPFMGVLPLDPSDSSQSRAVDVKKYSSYKRIEFCVSIQKGSTTGVFAAWRRGPGLLLKSLLDAPDSSEFFLVRYASTIFRLLILEVFFFTFFAGLFMAVYTPLALVRLVVIFTRAYLPATTQKWAMATEASSNPVLIQLSDTHVTAGGPPYEVTQDPQLWPHKSELNTAERLSKVFEAVNRLQSKPELIVFTGDLVDLGEKAEWNELGTRIKQFVSQTRELGGWLNKVMLIPGNHDVSINKGNVPDHTSDQRSARIYRCAKFIDEMEREFEPDHVNQEWNEKFPCLIRTSVAATEVNILALDSTRYSSHWVLSNAVGRFGKRQLNQTQELLASVSGPLIVLTHHHVSRPGYVRWSVSDRLMSPLKIAIDGHKLLEILSRYSREDGNSVLVTHGHQHQEFFEVYQPDRPGSVYVYGHPSSTMGIESDGVLDGVLRCAVIGLTKKKCWQITTHAFN